MRLLLGLVLFLFALCTPLIGEDLIDEKPVIKITIIEDETQGESEGEAEADSESRDASATAEEIDKREIPENAFDANDTSTKINENTTTHLAGAKLGLPRQLKFNFASLVFLECKVII